jgi:hypothetical protein
MSTSGVAGRLLIFKVHLPDAITPFTSANIYMPVASDNTNTRDDLESEIREQHDHTRLTNSHIILHGDFNATRDTKTDRLGYNPKNKCIKERDEHFNTMCSALALTSADTGHTWFSHDFRRSAKLDHVLHFPPTWTPSTTSSAPDLAITDHIPLHTQLPRDAGTLPPLQRHKPTPRIRTDAMKELTHIWQQAVESRLQSENAPTLARSQAIAIEEAAAIFGLTNYNHKKSTCSSEQHALQKPIATLRLIRRRIYGVLHATPSDDTLPRSRLTQAVNALQPISFPPNITPPPSPPNITNSSHAELRAYLERVLETGKQLQEAKRSLIHAMTHDRIEAIIKHKRATLFKPGSRMIQRAMGKDTATSEMTGMQTTHPDTVLFLVRSSHRPSAPQQMEEACKSLSIPATIRTH